MYKKFSEIDVNDTLYFIFDKYGILKNGDLKNINYGIAITTCKVNWFHKFSEVSDMAIELDRKIYNIDLWGKAFCFSEELVLGNMFSVPNKNYSRIHMLKPNFDMYCFTTKEEMESFINNSLSTILRNIEKIKKSLVEIK